MRLKSSVQVAFSHLHFAGYHDRPQQQTMADMVSDCLQDGGHALIQAPPGTGKSLAYLIPAILTGAPVIIATATKLLQDQLMDKDIPQAMAATHTVRVVCVKGQGNYLCKRRWQEAQPNLDVPQQRIVQRAMEQPQWDGDISNLPLLPGTRKHIRVDGQDCAWSKCPLYDSCHIKRLREQAEKAQIVVTNHALLCMKVVNNAEQVLPTIPNIIIDEGHHLEDQATSALAVSLASDDDLLRFVDRQHRPKLQQLLNRLWQQAFEALKGQTRIPVPPLPIMPIIDFLLQMPSHPKLQRTMQDLMTFVYESDTRVNYLQMQDSVMSLESIPVRVDKELAATLFTQRSIVITSATLAVGKSVSYLKGRLGLGTAKEAILPTVFDWQAQALLYVPASQLQPDHEGGEAYLQQLRRQMEDLVHAAQGGVFLLFTSRSTMQCMSQRLTLPGYTCLVQDGKLTRQEMITRFKAAQKGVLFGLKSFWEGVDIPGDALRLVVIDKLPFDPMGDPVHEARINDLKERGINAWDSYTLPRAIMALNQGVGRLLRDRHDRGVVAILDSRLRNKGYGPKILKALPDMPLTAELQDVIDQFAVTLV